MAMEHENHLKFWTGSFYEKESTKISFAVASTASSHYYIMRDASNGGIDTVAFFCSIPGNRDTILLSAVYDWYGDSASLNFHNRGLVRKANLGTIYL